MWNEDGREHQSQVSGRIVIGTESLDHLAPHPKQPLEPFNSKDIYRFSFKANANQ